MADRGGPGVFGDTLDKRELTDVQVVISAELCILTDCEIENGAKFRKATVTQFPPVETVFDAQSLTANNESVERGKLTLPTKFLIETRSLDRRIAAPLPISPCMLESEHHRVDSNAVFPRKEPQLHQLWRLAAVTLTETDPEEAALAPRSVEDDTESQLIRKLVDPYG